MKVYNLLKEQLGPEYVVYYSRPWLGLKPTGGEKDGECDFLVVHPKEGMLAIEVKGGKIDYDPEIDQWTSTDRDGFIHKIKDPIYQSRTAKHELLKKLRRTGKIGDNQICAVHGIIFPSADSPPKDLRADAPRKIFCCRDELPNLAGWVRKRMHDGADAKDAFIGALGIAGFDSILATPFSLRVPLGRWLDDDEQALEALTPQQFLILEAIQDISKAAIAGGAGTGKTVVALEDARRSAEEGLRTLMVCYSKPLALELQRRLSKAAPSVKVATFEELAREGAVAANIKLSPAASASALAEALLKASEVSSEHQWDAVIVDEGQDFDPVWWLSITAALTPMKRSRLHVFFDCNQKIYSRGGRPPEDFELVPIRLTRNLRSTKTIHEVAMCHYDGIEILPNDTSGQKVEIIPLPEMAELQTWLHSYIEKLTRSEGIAPGNIAVLHDGSIDPKAIMPTGRLGRQPVTGAEGLDEEAIVFDSIDRFKGLERQSIILLCSHSIFQKDEAAYVAASRARVQLTLAGHPAVIQWVAGARGLSPRR